MGTIESEVNDLMELSMVLGTVESINYQHKQAQRVKRQELRNKKRKARQKKRQHKNRK